VQLTAAGGTGTGYTFSATGLPAGMTISSTGTISGTPTVSGIFNYTVTVKDSAGNTGTVNCSVTVDAQNCLTKGDTATIGYWYNGNGQGLIDGANGGGSSRALANWLATQFPYLYGPQSSNNLTGQTNSAVASLFLTLFSGNKTGAQIMAAALACYFTDSTLSGTLAVGQGFNSSASGTGIRVYDVSSDGSGAGLTNNQNYLVIQLLQQVNTSVKNGTYSTGANSFNNIFSNINQNGDI
jgi:hypothetical protein